MNKKIFAIILVSIFLLSAISFVSAQGTSDSGNIVSKSFSVKIDWKDANQNDTRPDSITVNLMKNGEIISTKELKKDNSWSATFDVAEEGNFSVKQVSNLSNYNMSVNNNSNNEFVITYTLKDNASGEMQEDTSENTNEIPSIVIEESEVNNTNASDNETNSTDNSTDDNSTNKNITNNTTNNTTDNNNTENNTNSTVNNNDVIKNTPKPVHKEDKKPIITKNKLLKVGIPVAILIVAILTAVILRRRE